jgi:hypothetical protein
MQAEGAQVAHALDLRLARDVQCRSLAEDDRWMVSLIGITW